VTRERPIPPSTDPAPRSGADRRRMPPATPALPEREPARPWLGWVAAVALAALAYGALRDDRPERGARSAASDTARRTSPTRRERATTSEGALQSAPRTPADSDPQQAPADRQSVDAGDPGASDPSANDPASPAPEAPAEPTAGARAAHAPKGTPDAGARHPALPPGHPAPDELPAPPEEAPEELASPVIRRVELTFIRRWQQPGLCQQANAASAARRRMMIRFRRVDWAPDALMFIDPRLFRSSQETLVESLGQAEREIAEQLALHPSRPDVFAYRDTQLMLAGSCANDGVVAYYDGDLHVVPTHADLQESVTHEYTHHALMAAGLLGPAWAQEGIAMNVARETWWQTPEWLERIAAQPYSIEIMERTVPYTMTSEEALSFYVQAGAMVRCATLNDPDGLRGLVQRLRAGGSGGSLQYELPALADPSSLRACARALLK